MTSQDDKGEISKKKISRLIFLVTVSFFLSDFTFLVLIF